jgi:hypothetical protein
MNKEEIIKEVITLLDTSNYVDPAEHLYDGLKQIKREITYATLHDFLWALESSTVTDVDGRVTECANKIKPLLADMTIDEAYENYSKEYVKENSIGMCLLIARMDGKSTYRKPNKEMFIDLCTHDKTFSETWGLKIEERELSLSERGELFRKTYPGKSVDDFAPSGMEVQSIRHQLDTRYNKSNIPTKLITITYNNKTIESYE